MNWKLFFNIGSLNRHAAGVWPSRPFVVPLNDLFIYLFIYLGKKKM